MIGIAQYDLSTYFFCELMCMYGLNSAGCTYRHKYWGLNITVVSGDDTYPGFAVFVGMYFFKFHFFAL